jgi:hypothetical protein
MSSLEIKGLVIHPSLFGRASGPRCRIETCQASCCRNGVFMDSEHADRVMSHHRQISALLPEERRDPTLWFDAEIDDPDFPSGRATGAVALPDPFDESRTSCVFLLENRFCALQVLSEQLGLGYPGLKPFDCAMYPILLSRGELTFDRWSPAELEGADCQQKSAGAPPRVLEVFAGELRLALGDDGYQTLCAAAPQDEP